MIQLSSLSKSFGDRVLLDAVTWQIDDPDAGTVVKPAGLTIGYLPQDGLAYSGRTLREEASLAFKPLLDMKAEIASLEERLGDEAASHGEHEQMLTRYSELQEQFRRGD